jgi:cytochrome c-type biogenesis protein CcmH
MLATRLILIGAAAIAAVSVGVATLKPKTATPDEQAAPQTLDQAIAEVEAKVKANPNDAQGWVTLGRGFVQAERFGEAATAYRRAAQLTPANAESWSDLGEALVMAAGGNVPPDAKTAFTTALDRDPKNVRARYFMAVAKDITGDHRAAIDDWFAILKETPANAPWQQDIRGLIERVAGEQKIDVKSRLAALPPSPRGPNSPAGQAVKDLPADQQQAMIASMVDGLSKRLEENPKDVEGWTMLMRSYAALDRKGDAKAALDRAIKANPNAATTLNQTAAQLGLR